MKSHVLMLTLLILYFMLYRALDYIENETGENILCNFNTAISFVDRDGIADWATEPIRILSSVGLFQGTAQKKICLIAIG